MDLFDLSYGPAVRAAAARIDQTGAELRERAGRLRSASASCEWDGAGARAFRRSAGGTYAWIERAGRLLDEAAAALRMHAAVVTDAVVEEEARRARAEREFAERIAERVADVLHIPHPGHDR